ncbi:MAG: DnaJ family molecular chaperone [Alphaproteobacteria bacterium]
MKSIYLYLLLGFFYLFAPRIEEYFSENIITPDNIFYSALGFVIICVIARLFRNLYLWLLKSEASIKDSETAQKQKVPPPFKDMSYDPYKVLNISPDASDEEIKKQWLKLVKANHPDTLSSSEKSDEKIANATKMVSDINAAYDDIVRERKL